jgi:CspA family cold shock protein
MPDPNTQKYHSDIEAVVKWFDPTKGFGYIEVSDGSPDAFLHSSVMEESGVRELSRGTVLFCEIVPGERGPKVTSIHFVDSQSGLANQGGTLPGSSYRKPVEKRAMTPKRRFG